MKICLITFVNLISISIFSFFFFVESMRKKVNILKWISSQVNLVTCYLVFLFYLLLVIPMFKVVFGKLMTNLNISFFFFFVFFIVAAVLLELLFLLILICVCECAVRDYYPRQPLVSADVLFFVVTVAFNFVSVHKSVFSVPMAMCSNQCMSILSGFCFFITHPTKKKNKKQSSIVYVSDGCAV